MATGTQQDPFTGTDCNDIARDMVQGVFRDREGRPTLVFWQGEWFEFRAEQWRRRDREWVRRKLRRLLSRSWVRLEDGTGVSRWKCDLKSIDEVAHALSAAMDWEGQVMPGWLGVPGEMDPKWCIGFRDKVVSVEGGEVREVDRTSEWFDASVVQCDYVPGARCENWERCLEEWSGGEEAWKTLLQRWMGYCLMGHRDFARWMLMKGEPRSGKGTIAWVIGQLLGDEGMQSSSLYALADKYGAWGLESAKVLSIVEASDLGTREGERAAHFIKAIVGQDPVRIDRKYQSVLRNVRLDLAVMMQSNQVVRLPNKGRGLSDKMLVLSFETSFTGREDVQLKNKLSAEMEGIAAWAVEGARQLVTARPGEWFPDTERGAAELREYMLENNEADRFLEEWCTQDDEGFVTTELLWGAWRAWRRENRPRLFDPAKGRFAARLEQETTWRLRRHRRGQHRGLRGLALRREPRAE